MCWFSNDCEKEAFGTEPALNLLHYSSALPSPMFVSIFRRLSENGWLDGMLRCCNAMTFWPTWNVPMESPDKMSPIFCASSWPKALRCVAESELHGSHAAPSNLVISPFAFSKHQFSESISPDLFHLKLTKVNTQHRCIPILPSLTWVSISGCPDLQPTPASSALWFTFKMLHTGSHQTFIKKLIRSDAWKLWPAAHFSTNLWTKDPSVEISLCRRWAQPPAKIPQFITNVKFCIEVLVFIHKAWQTLNRVLQKTDSYQGDGSNVENITVMGPSQVLCETKQVLYYIQ